MSTTPRQFGPTSTAPAARAIAQRLLLRPGARPAPSSERPAVITTSARAPAATASRTAATKPADGHADHDQVDGSGAVGARRRQARGTSGGRAPRAPRRLTSGTGRVAAGLERPAGQDVAPLRGSSLAPTTATERRVEERLQRQRPECGLDPGPLACATLDASSWASLASLTD